MNQDRESESEDKSVAVAAQVGQAVVFSRQAMMERVSAVREHGIPEPAETVAAMADKLRFHTDSWDLSLDLKAGRGDFVVVDARPPEAYAGGHIPGALSLPRRDMTPAATAAFDRGKLYVIQCDGIGCNASTKGALRLAQLGFRVKELLGGLDWWRRDGHPVTRSPEPGSMAAQPGPGVVNHRLLLRTNHVQCLPVPRVARPLPGVE